MKLLKLQYLCFPLWHWIDILVLLKVVLLKQKQIDCCLKLLFLKYSLGFKNCPVLILNQELKGKFQSIITNGLMIIPDFVCLLWTTRLCLLVLINLHNRHYLSETNSHRQSCVLFKISNFANLKRNYCWRRIKNLSFKAHQSIYNDINERYQKEVRSISVSEI